MVTGRISRMLQETKKDKALETYLFEKLSSTDRPFRWLQILKEQGYFDPSKNPSPEKVREDSYVVPQWKILGYLDNVSKHLRITPEKEIIELLLSIIDPIIDKRVENYRTDWVIIKVLFNLPIEYITVDHIRFIKTALLTNPILISAEVMETVLPYLIRNNANELILVLLDIILDYNKRTTPLTTEYVSILDDYWLSELLKKFSRTIFDICGLQSTIIALSKIESITNEDKNKYIASVITIEDSTQNLSRDSFEIQSVFFVRNTLMWAEPKDARAIVRDLIKRDHSIFRRIAINTISYHYEELADVFWVLEREGNPLEDTWVTHELYEFFKNNCKKFNEEQLKTIVNWVETRKFSLPKEIIDSPREQEKYLALHRKEWLSALLESGKPNIKQIYEKYDQINPTEIEHPGFLIWFSGVTVSPEPQPVDFGAKTNLQIAQYLASQGDAASFRVSTKKNSERLSRDMKPFLSISREMQHALLAGLYDAWESGEDIVWDELLDFVLAIIEQSSLWQEQQDGHIYIDWIVAKIAELIGIGIKDETRCLSEDLLPKVEQILLMLAERDRSKLLRVTSLGLVNASLNSPKGAIFTTMVYYSLRYARLKKEWSRPTRLYFEKCLAEDSTPIEFYVTFGLYLYSIYSIKPAWVKENINRIFPKEREESWRASFTGFLFGASRIYKEIYEILKANNHYLKALDTVFEDKYTMRRLIDHISVGYLNDLESLDDSESLICQIISRRDPKQLSDMTNFFWTLRNKISDEQRKKVVPLWQKIIQESGPAKDDTRIRSVLAGLSRWITLLDRLDEETTHLLMTSASCLKKDYNLISFGENLMEHVEMSPDKVGEILLSMTNAGVFLTYKVENAQRLVRSLYERNEKEKADEICRLYARRGFFFLKEIYEEYNP